MTKFEEKIPMQIFQTAALCLFAAGGLSALEGIRYYKARDIKKIKEELSIINSKAAEKRFLDIKAFSALPGSSAADEKAGLLSEKPFKRPSGKRAGREKEFAALGDDDVTKILIQAAKGVCESPGEEDTDILPKEDTDILRESIEEEKTEILPDIIITEEERRALFHKEEEKAF